MTIETTSIDGLFLLRCPTYDDHRGFFRETLRADELCDVLGREVVWQQSNHARSLPGVLRGFHAEPWDKCVYVARGTVLSAIADIRPDSPTFGHTATLLLGDAPGERSRLFIAEGLANAYCTVGDRSVDYLYETSALWRPDVDRNAVAWDDPDLGIAWPVTDPILSAEDRANPTLRERFHDHPRFRSEDAGRPLADEPGPGSGR